MFNIITHRLASAGRVFKIRLKINLPHTIRFLPASATPYILYMYSNMVYNAMAHTWLHGCTFQNLSVFVLLLNFTNTRTDLFTDTKIQNTKYKNTNKTKHTKTGTSFKVGRSTGLFFAIILLGYQEDEFKVLGETSDFTTTWTVSNLTLPSGTLLAGIFFFKMILLTVFPIAHVRKKFRQDGKRLKASCGVFRSTYRYCIFRDGWVGGLRLEVPLIDPEQVIRLDR